MPMHLRVFASPFLWTHKCFAHGLGLITRLESGRIKKIRTIELIHQRDISLL
jgi:hypothetical protein